MRILLLTISLLITLPLAASDQMEQLYQTVLESLRAHKYDSTTISHGMDLLHASKQADDPYYIVRSYYILGFSYSKTKEFGKAVLSYLEGARYAEKSSEKKIKENLISIYKNLAVIMGDYRHFDLAHRFNQKGVEIARDISNERQVVNLLQNDEYEYVEDEKYDSALQVLNTIFNNYSLELERKMKLVNDLGIAYRKLGRLDAAIEQYKSILDVRDSIQDIGFVAKVLHNLGSALMYRQEYVEALVYFREAAEINSSEEHTNNLSGNYKYTGVSLYKLGRKDEALAYYLKAAELFDSEYVDPEDYDIFELIADFYQAENRHELAREYERKYEEHLQSFNETQATMRLPAELLLQVEELLNDNESLSMRSRQIILGVLTLSAVLFSTLVYLYQRRRHRVQEEEKRVDEQEQFRTRQELASALGISYQTLRRRLVESDLRIPSRKYLNPSEQQTILEYLKKQ